ncbi:MAG: 5'-nucleosidase, partial [Campylobacter sp.]|nr:5'-nucleosidase [Campylobacteraceae bacterium]MDY5888473.1 5'-nucleosidase [Campylobacter sp.]
AMDAIDAAKLLYRMEAKKISAVLAKMDAAKAVELTNLIREGKIFDENSSKDNSAQNGDENASAN